MNEIMNKYSKEKVLEKTQEYFNGGELESTVWINKYALKDEDNLYELSPDDMHIRLAKELARIENKYPNPINEKEIYELIKNFKYIVPQGGPMSGIGNNLQTVSLSNCFVVGNTADSYGGIFMTDQEQAQLMKRRGGVGHDLSHIRPKGTTVKNSALTSTGVFPFMERYSNTTREVAQDGRRGALMLTLDIRHPDSEYFIDAKIDRKKVTGANISVKLSDDFMNSVFDNEPFYQQYPVNSDNPIVKIEADAKELWNKIVHNAWQSAEPGLFFWSQVERESIPDCYEEHGFKTVSTNPCGEIPLCPYDSCRLTAINLYSYVENPFTDNATFNEEKFRKDVRIAMRFMDDIVDLEIEKIDAILKKVESDPEDDHIKEVEINLWQKIKEKGLQGRRTGLGVTAEGDMLAALGYRYGTNEATDFSENIHKILAIEAYKSSCIMAKERGSFEVWDYEKEKNNPFIQRLIEADKELAEMLKQGRRNISLLTIAPTGSVSIMTETTSGIEPAFLISYKRRRKINPNDKDAVSAFVDTVGDHWEEYQVIHPKFKVWLQVKGYDIKEVERYDDEEMQKLIEKSPYYLATSNDVNWVEKVIMQGKIQKWVDHSISVTVNLPKDIEEHVVGDVYETAWRSGCFRKNHTVYTSNGIKSISDIEINDRVIGIDGKEHRVNEVYNLPIEQRNFVKYKATGFEEIDCTEEHPILVCEFISNKDYKKSWFEREKKISWKLAKDLKIGDHILTPSKIDIKDKIYKIKISDIIDIDYILDDEYIYLSRKLPWKNKYVKSANSNKIKNEIILDNDFMKLLGWFIAEGHYSKKSSLRMNFNINEKSIVDELQMIIEDKFGLPCRQEIIESNGKSLRLEFYSRIVSNLFEKLIGRKSINKKLPFFYTSIKEELLETLIHSYYLGDKGSTISKILSKQFIHAKLILGKRPYYKPNYVSNYLVGESNSLKQMTTAKPVSDKNNNYLAYRINNIEYFKSNEKVYNFSVEDVDSYIVNGSIVHNCKGVTVYRDGSRDGVLISDKDEKSVDDMIKENNAPRRPKRLDCEVIRFTNKGEKWVAFLGMLDFNKDGEKYPYEIFTGKLDAFQVPNFVEEGVIVKFKMEDGTKRYDFEYKDKDGYVNTMRGLSRAFDEQYWDYAKMISAFLRHRIHLPTVINLIDGVNLDGDLMGTWKAGVKRILKRFVKDGSDAKGKKCDSCGSHNLKYESGCLICQDCGYSYCD